MKCTFCLLFHLLTTLAKLIRPGGSRAVIAENLLLRQQLIIHSRARQRAPNLIIQDRALLGFLSLFLNPRRIARLSIIVKPSTLGLGARLRPISTFRYDIVSFSRNLGMIWDSDTQSARS